MIKHLITLPFSALGWVGKRGAAAVAISVVIGMLLPTLSAYARPFITPAVFVLLVLAFLRVDGAAIARRIKRPTLLAMSSLWMLLALPLLALGLARLTGLDDLGSDFMLAMFIATAAPSVMSAPAFIYLMGLDGALSLTVLIFGVVLTPITVPIIGGLMLGPALPLSTVGLGLQLFSLLAGSWISAWLIRKLAGRPRIDAARHQIDGINVLVLFFFAVAAMDGVAASFLERPLFTTSIASLTFVLAFAQIGLTLLVFSPANRADAFVIAHSSGARNMGLLVAALGGTLPDGAWLWFALAQLPIYMLPYILRPFGRWYSGVAENVPST